MSLLMPIHNFLKITVYMIVNFDLCVPTVRKNSMKKRIFVSILSGEVGLQVSR